MFLRRKNNSSRAVGYSDWCLCEAYRTARGPQQRVVASLGKLDEPRATMLAQGWDDLAALLTGERTAATGRAATATVGAGGRARCLRSTINFKPGNCGLPLP